MVPGWPQEIDSLDNGALFLIIGDFVNILVIKQSEHCAVDTSNGAEILICGSDLVIPYLPQKIS